MLVINAGSRRPGAERRVVAWLAAFEGVGLVVPGVHIPGRRRYRRGGSEVDLLVFTPHVCVIVAVESVRFRVSGTLSCPGDGPWSLPDVVGDPIALRRKGDSNPLNPAADSRDDLRGVLEQKLCEAAADLLVDVVVLVVPQYGYPIELVTTAMPVGCDVLLGNNSGELYRWLDAHAYGDAEAWTADRLLVVLAALNITEITWGDLIGIGFPAEPVAGSRVGGAPAYAARPLPAPQFPVVWAPFAQPPAGDLVDAAVSAEPVAGAPEVPASVAVPSVSVPAEVGSPATHEAEPDSPPMVAPAFGTPPEESVFGDAAVEELPGEDEVAEETVAESAGEPLAQNPIADEPVNSVVDTSHSLPSSPAGEPIPAAESSEDDPLVGIDRHIAGRGPADSVPGPSAPPRRLPGVPRPPVQSRKHRDVVAMLRAAGAFAVLIAGVWTLVDTHHAQAHPGDANTPVVATSVVPPPFPAAGLPVAPPPGPAPAPIPAELSVLGPGAAPCYPLQPNC